MSEQRAEYHYDGKEKARKQLDSQLIARLVEDPEQFAEQLEEDQACAILNAIVAKYPEMSQKVIENMNNVQGS